MPRLRLRKWYLDIVTDDARCVIGYWGRIEWGPVTLAYSAILDARAASPVTRTRWRATDEPANRNGTIDWSCPALCIDGRWHARAPALQRTLLGTEEGEAVWSCLQPASEVQVQLDAETLHGNGYAEYLEMTLPPWRLPIEDLRWGRAVAPDPNRGDGALASVVWIRWIGAHPLTLVALNGVEVPDAVVEDNAVRAAGTGVALEPGRVLRQGPLLTSALRGAPGLSSWAPASILGAHETKRLSPCSISLARHPPGTSPRPGWAIHESVLFKPEPRR